MIPMDIPNFAPPIPPALAEVPVVPPPRWIDALAALPCVVAGSVFVAILILAIRGRPIDAEYTREFESPRAARETSRVV